jgi:sulfur-oxidizing protein SoxY
MSTPADLLRVALVCLAGIVFVAPAAAQKADPAKVAKDLPDSNRNEDPEASPRWKAVRQSVWGAQAIAAATEAQLVLAAPKRAGDPAFVPIAVKSTIAAGQPGSIKRITLVIDNNPSPIAAILDFPEGGALPSFETRTRIDEYSHVRAIAETRDGKLLMASRFVKASGGCSAPPGGDLAAMEASMGKMLFRTDTQAPTQAAAGGAIAVQWTLSHPNHSGMAMDQFTRQYTPAHFLRSVRFTQGERLLLEADVDFALSENPTLRFEFVPQGNAPLKAEAADTRDKRFAGSTRLEDMR